MKNDLLKWEDVAGSSHVQSRAYDRKNKMLYVRFKNSDKTYRYVDVPESVVIAFRNAVSPGNFINTVLRDNYKVEKV